MPTIYISQPMSGRSEAEIIEERNRAVEEIIKIYGADVEICDNYHTDCERNIVASTTLQYNTNHDLYWLGEALKVLSWADVIWFCADWEFSRGCKIENMAALFYGVERVYPWSAIRAKMKNEGNEEDN